jgi:tetratricopeptide (TPR) repeat protein
MRLGSLIQAALTPIRRRWLQRQSNTEIVRIARQSLLRGRIEQALVCGRILIRRSPRDAEGWFLSGACLLALGRQAEFLRELRMVPRELRHRPSLALLASRACEELGDLEGAVRWMRHVAADREMLAGAQGSAAFSRWQAGTGAGADFHAYS